MPYRESQAQSRSRYLAAYDAEGAKHYDAYLQSVVESDLQACLADIQEVFHIESGMSVLDVGAGTGALTMVLNRLPGIRLTAMEPSPHMGTLIPLKAGLSSIRVVESFCDHVDDRKVFPPGSWGVIASQRLVNCLYDPLAAFRNWYHWLRPGGAVLILDGLYGRDGWTGEWQEVVDHLPLSACQTTACVPYLLEQCGFQCTHSGLMTRVNRLTSTRTQRYLVVARKPV